MIKTWVLFEKAYLTIKEAMHITKVNFILFHTEFNQRINYSNEAPLFSNRQCPSYYFDSHTLLNTRTVEDNFNSAVASMKKTNDHNSHNRSYYRSPPFSSYSPSKPLPAVGPSSSSRNNYAPPPYPAGFVGGPQSNPRCRFSYNVARRSYESSTKITRSSKEPHHSPPPKCPPKRSSTTMTTKTTSDGAVPLKRARIASSSGELPSLPRDPTTSDRGLTEVVTQRSVVKTARGPPKFLRPTLSDGRSPNPAFWDPFCWVCHSLTSKDPKYKNDSVVQCLNCPRSLHPTCILANTSSKQYTESDFICPECQSAMKPGANNLSPNNVNTPPERFKKFFEFAHCRMRILISSKRVSNLQTYFPVDPDYIVYPLNPEMIEKNIQEMVYTSTAKFLGDIRWLYHNAYIMYGPNGMADGASSKSNPSTSVLEFIKKLENVCTEEVNEMTTCPECYHNAYSLDDWFACVCSPLHTLVWAKVRGFPFWPGKALRINITGNSLTMDHLAAPLISKPNSGVTVDVRFFGTHDKAWVPGEKCYLLSQNPPFSSTASKLSTRVKRDYEASFKELAIHMANIHLLFDCPFPYASENTLIPVMPESLFHLDTLLSAGAQLKSASNNKVPRFEITQSQGVSPVGVVKRSTSTTINSWPTLLSIKGEPKDDDIPAVFKPSVSKESISKTNVFSFKTVDIALLLVDGLNIDQPRDATEDLSKRNSLNEKHYNTDKCAIATCQLSDFETINSAKSLELIDSATAIGPIKSPLKSKDLTLSAPQDVPRVKLEHLPGAEIISTGESTDVTSKNLPPVSTTETVIGDLGNNTSVLQSLIRMSANGYLPSLDSDEEENEYDLYSFAQSPTINIVHTSELLITKATTASLVNTTNSNIAHHILVSGPAISTTFEGNLESTVMCPILVLPQPYQLGIKSSEMALPKSSISCPIITYPLISEKLSEVETLEYKYNPLLESPALPGLEKILPLKIPIKERHSTRSPATVRLPETSITDSIAQSVKEGLNRALSSLISSSSHSNGNYLGQSSTTLNQTCNKTVTHLTNITSPSTCVVSNHAVLCSNSSLPIFKRVTSVEETFPLGLSLTPTTVAPRQCPFLQNQNCNNDLSKANMSANYDELCAPVLLSALSCETTPITSTLSCVSMMTLEKDKSLSPRVIETFNESAYNLISSSSTSTTNTQCSITELANNALFPINSPSLGYTDLCMTSSLPSQTAISCENISCALVYSLPPVSMSILETKDLIPTIYTPLISNVDMPSPIGPFTSNALQVLTNKNSLLPMDVVVSTGFSGPTGLGNDLRLLLTRPMLTRIVRSPVKLVPIAMSVESSGEILRPTNSLIASLNLCSNDNECGFIQNNVNQKQVENNFPLGETQLDFNLNKAVACDIENEEERPLFEKNIAIQTPMIPVINLVDCERDKLFDVSPFITQISKILTNMAQKIQESVVQIPIAHPIVSEQHSPSLVSSGDVISLSEHKNQLRQAWHHSKAYYTKMLDDALRSFENSFKLMEMWQLDTLSKKDAKIRDLEIKVREGEERFETKNGKYKKEISQSFVTITNLKNEMSREREETRKVIVDIKRKQWCVNCLKEAIFYCCVGVWYCDTSCQKEHWNVHKDVCQEIKKVRNSHGLPQPTGYTQSNVSESLHSHFPFSQDSGLRNHSLPFQGSMPDTSYSVREFLQSSLGTIQGPFSNHPPTSHAPP